MFMASNVNTIICDEVDALTPSSPTKGPQKLGPGRVSLCGQGVLLAPHALRCAWMLLEGLGVSLMKSCGA